jgi:hypothetical protein
LCVHFRINKWLKRVAHAEGKNDRLTEIQDRNFAGFMVENLAGSLELRAAEKAEFFR